jgi:hypothetical protein
VGHPNASSGRLSGLQEVFANEVTDEEGSAGQNQSLNQQNVRSFDTAKDWRRGF